MASRRGLILLAAQVLALALGECALARNRVSTVPYIEFGGSYFNHYDMKYTPIVQPPPTLFARGEVGAWLSEKTIAYAFLMTGISPAVGRAMGGGLKLHFFSIGPKHDMFDGTFNTYIAGDVMYLSPRPPVLPDRYQASGAAIRVGGTGVIAFGGGFFLEGSLYLFRYSGALMIMPGLGFGRVF